MRSDPPRPDLPGPDPPRHRGRWFVWAGLVVVISLLVGVGLSNQFPDLAGGPRSSTELLEELYEAPFVLAKDSARYLAARAAEDALALFIRSCDLPGETRERLIAHVRGEGFERRTVPFVFYLYDLYGAALSVEPGAEADLGYAEPAEPAEPAGDGGGPGLSSLVRGSARLRGQAAVALRLYDALFLHLKPGAENEPLARDRYEEDAYREIRDVVRTVARQTLLKEGRGDEGDSDYVAAVEEILDDDERFSVFVQFFTDFVRQLADGWMEAYVRREQRKERRLAWVREQIAANRYHAIADYAGSRLERRLVFHLAVDGLQGRLLEGLADLSAGDRQSGAARYVADLVRLHRRPVMGPARYDSGMPPALGHDIAELADRAPVKPSYLRHFKEQCYGPDAACVIVDVATVDTPAISVRNLPLIQTGHGVAGSFGTGIPNFSYLDRRSAMGWYYWGSDVLYLADVFANREGRIPHGRRREGSGAKTLFERLWRYNTVSSMATLDAGALEKISAEVGLAVGELRRNFIEKVMVLRFRHRAAMEIELDRRRRWLAGHGHLSRSFLGSLVFDAGDLKTFREHAEYLAVHEDEGLPDYLLWYNPWPDHFAHGAGPYSDAIVGYRGELDRLDFYLGKMVELYRRAGCYDRTLFGVVSDHGLIYTPLVISTDAVLFDSMKTDGLEVRVKKLTHDEGGLPALHDRRRLEPLRDLDVVVGSTAGGSYIMDLFDPASGGDEAAYRRHPGYHDLLRHTLRSGRTVDWIAQLRRRLRGKMDLALVREHGPERNASWPDDVVSVVRVITPERGEARIYRLRSDAGELRYRYEVLGDRDPLDLLGSVRGYLISPGEPSSERIRTDLARCIEAPQGCDDREWGVLLSYTLRPDVIHQYSHLYDSERAGTINVFPVRHVGMNSGVPGRHAGEAFGEKNGTQIYWGAGLEAARIRTARNGSLPVTLYHWLVGDREYLGAHPGAGFPPSEQLGFPSLLADPAFAPLRP